MFYALFVYSLDSQYYQNPAKLMNIHQNQPKSIKIHQIASNQSKSIKTNQNQSKSIKFHQNQTKSIKFHQNQLRPTKINTNHMYMHQNHQRQRKSKSNTFWHILGLLVSNVWPLNLHSWSLTRAKTRARVRGQDDLFHFAQRSCFIWRGNLGRVGFKRRAK